MAAQKYEADLHIHSLLSPCGEIEMIPSLIIEAAVRAGLDIIGITDHNSCENAGAVVEASIGSGVKVLPGLEVQSLEGVHLLCLFDSVEQATALQEAVYASLPSPSPVGEGRGEVQASPLLTKEGSGEVGADVMLNSIQHPKAFAEQMIVDSRDEFVGYCERHLSLPTSMDIDEIWQRVNSLGGILIPSHIDRRSTGLCDVLGMVPDAPDFAAVEISRNLTPLEARTTYPSIGKRSILCNSDAHWLAAIGERRTTFYLEHRTIAEIALACKGEAGRRVGHV
jgi:PHP family Zn ribbon phosphoesterase